MKLMITVKSKREEKIKEHYEILKCLIRELLDPSSRYASVNKDLVNEVIGFIGAVYEQYDFNLRHIKKRA